MKGSGQSKRLWDPMGMMTDTVQKHLSVNTMSVANLSFLSYLGEHQGVRCIHKRLLINIT